jgi:hypothetical protein
MDAGEEFGDMERRAGLFEYVECHIDLGQTFLEVRARAGSVGRALTKAANRAQLCIQRSFVYGEQKIFEVIVHGGLLSMGSRVE